METEIVKTFLVDVKITKATPGILEGTTNYEEILKKIKTGIAEAVAICAGVINSYQVGKILEVTKKDEEKDWKILRKD